MEKENKKETIQLLMVIGMYLALILLLIAIIAVVKNAKELKSDPIIYGINQKNLEFCSCYDGKGVSYDYNSTGIIPKQTGGFNIQIPGV